MIYKNIRCWLTQEDEPRLMWEELPYAVWLSWERHAEVIYKVWRTGVCYAVLSNDDITKAAAEHIANSYETGEVKVHHINLRSDAP